MNKRAIEELRAMKHQPQYRPTSLTMEEYQRDMDMIFHCSTELGPDALRYYDANGLILGAGDHLVILFSENGDHPGVEYRWYSDRYRLVLKLLTETLDGKYRCYAAETDGRLMVLVCFPWHYENGLEQIAAGTEVESLCRQVIERCGELYQMQVSAYVSQFCDSPRDITRVCNQVRVYMEFQQFIQDNSGVHRINLSGTPLMEVSEFTKAAERIARKVLEKIYACDSDFTEEIGQILFQLTEYPPYDVSVLLSNLQRMISGCYNQFLEHRIFSAKELDEENLAENYLYFTEELHSIGDVEKRLQDFFRFAYRQYHREKEPWEGTIDRVPEYLMEHFTRPELSVAEIAEVVRMKSSTLCSAYKRKMGVTIFDTILQLRLDRAEELMEDDKLNLRDICDSSGFGSLESMYRAFKKKYGQSPGQFRAGKRRNQM